MSDQTPGIETAGNAAIDALSAEHFEPAIHRAVVDSEAAGASRNDILSALANAYSRTLIALLGETAAAGMLDAQAAHMRALGKN
jgi:hypothetical protein